MNDSSEKDLSDIGILEFALKILTERESGELAMRLVERFGSVPCVFRATHAELVRVPGVTDRIAHFFEFASSARRQAILRELFESPLNCERRIVDFCEIYFSTDTEPSEACIFLNDEGRLVSVKRLFAKEPARQMLCNACRIGAASVIRIAYSPQSGRERAVRNSARFVLPFRIARVDLLDSVVYSPPYFLSERRLALKGSRFIPAETASNETYTFALSDKLKQKFF